MCGILGIYSSKGIQPYLSEVQSANDLVTHRGPDGAGFALFNTKADYGNNVVWSSFLVENCAVVDHPDMVLAHRRLAIIDLSPAGLQPMGTSDRSLWITYNGEIYNYLELRNELESLGHAFSTHTDTEVILYSYQQWGDDCIHRFNGMWAFAILDLVQKRLFCSRDRFGVKPFHYYYDGQHLAFASEIKQLLMFPFVPKHINDRIVYEYLSFQAIEHSVETFFTGIYNLLPGHNLIYEYQTHTLHSCRYYDPKIVINNTISLEESAEEVARLLKDSVRLRLRSDVKVGTCLSGGLDSSSIVCIMNSLLREQGLDDTQHTFSSHFEEKEANEIEYMETVIQATQVTPHFTYPTPDGLLQELERLVWHQEEPFGSTSIYAQWSVFKLARENGVTVMLDGQGADELLAGYLPYPAYIYLKELVLKRKFLACVEEARRFRIPFVQILLPVVLHEFVIALRRHPRLYEYIKRFRPQRNRIQGNKYWLPTALYNRYEEQSYFTANQQKCMFEEKNECLNNYLFQLTFCNNLQALLKYEDRNSMAFSTEGRVPFLDYRLVEFLFSLPSNFKLHNGFSKFVFRQGMGGILPEKIRWRTTKLGFSTPERLWQKTSLRPLIELALDDPILEPYIHRERAREYLDKVQQSQQSDFTPWRWLNLALWMKGFNLEPARS